jgi:hypothetical protein
MARSPARRKRSVAGPVAASVRPPQEADRRRSCPRELELGCLGLPVRHISIQCKEYRPCGLYEEPD